MTQPTPSKRPSRLSPVTREVLHIAFRTVLFFLMLLAVLIMWRGSAVFLYEGF